MIKIAVGLYDAEGPIFDLMRSRVDEDTIQIPYTGKLKGKWPQNSLVEIFGAWEELCLGSAIVHSINNFNLTRVPKGFTASARSEIKNYRGLERHVASNSRVTVDYLYYGNSSFHYFIPRGPKPPK